MQDIRFQKQLICGAGFCFDSRLGAKPTFEAHLAPSGIPQPDRNHQGTTLRKITGRHPSKRHSRSGRG